jgi:hypothetical protein
MRTASFGDGVSWTGIATPVGRAYDSAPMERSALTDTAVPDRWTARDSLRLVETGVLGPGDRVELPGRR